MEARKVIERRMEAFKVVERETKTKAYSKEGLARDQPMTAEERKRMRVREWVQVRRRAPRSAGTCLHPAFNFNIDFNTLPSPRTPRSQEAAQKLSDAVDELEAEAEAAEAAGDGRSKKERDALAHLEKVMRTHRFHVDKLEAVSWRLWGLAAACVAAVAAVIGVAPARSSAGRHCCS